MSAPGRASGSAPLRPRLAAELLRAGRAVDVPVGGGSMRPLFRPGDVLRVRPAGGADVRPGDVVLFQLDDGRLVCHRLLYAAGDRVVTRGDDAFAADPPLPAAAIIGRVEVPPSPRALYCAVRALLR